MLKTVKCSICGCHCDGEEAGIHKNLTKHNNWELLCETEINSLGVENTQGVALDTMVVSLVTKDKTRR